MEGVEGKQGKEVTKITTKTSGKVTGEKETVEPHGNPTLYQQPVAHVGFKARSTQNLGDYNSVSFEVSLTVPCLPNELGDVFEYAKGWVDQRLTAVIEEFYAEDGTEEPAGDGAVQ